MDTHSTPSDALVVCRMPHVGDHAPWVDGLINQSGRTVDLRKLRGRQVLLNFHPHEHAPPCLVEGYNFLARHGISGVVIFGVGVNRLDSDPSFTQEDDPLFDHLFESEHRLARAYGVFPANDGQPCRASFLIGRKGGIAHIWINADQDRFWHEVRDLTTAGRPSAGKTSRRH